MALLIDLHLPKSSSKRTTHQNHRSRRAAHFNPQYARTLVKQQSLNQEHAEVLVMNISELAAGNYVVEAIGRKSKGVERLVKH